MRIVITGHRGQLGKALQRALAGKELSGMDLPEHDITDPASAIDTVIRLEPDLVIHAGDLTDAATLARLESLPRFVGVAGNMDGPAVRSSLKSTRTLRTLCNRNPACARA